MPYFVKRLTNIKKSTSVKDTFVTLSIMGRFCFYIDCKRASERGGLSSKVNVSSLKGELLPAVNFIGSITAKTNKYSNGVFTIFTCHPFNSKQHKKCTIKHT